MTPLRLLQRLLLGAAVALAAAGCASVPSETGKDNIDPFERYNRHVFEFNDTIDRNVLVPVAQGYRAVVPGPARDCIRNVFENLYEPWTIVNDILQAKPGDAAKNVLRFGVNTLFGLGGCIDIASHMQGLQRQPEDFGQTLGRWGVGPGAYFVLPIFGPSTIRDTGGFFVDRLGEPLGTITCCTEYWVATGTRVVSLREGVLDATRAADQAALDRYLFYRDAYLQRRRFLIYDGNVPDEDGYPDDSYTAPPAGGRSAVDQQPPVTPPVNRLPR